MQRISIFEWYSRTAPDKEEWALEYYEVEDVVAEQIEDWATPLINEDTHDLEIIS